MIRPIAMTIVTLCSTLQFKYMSFLYVTGRLSLMFETLKVPFLLSRVCRILSGIRWKWIYKLSLDKGTRTLGTRLLATPIFDFHWVLSFLSICLSVFESVKRLFISIF